MDIRGNCIEAKKALEIMSALPVIDSVATDFSCLPYNNSLMEVTAENGSRKDAKVKYSCLLCSSLVDPKQMRKHVVGVHILKEKIMNACGFCGMRGCDIKLKVASGRGKTATIASASNCEYEKRFSMKSAESSTKSGPCTNRPIECKI